MKKEAMIKECVTFGLESEENKKEVVDAACRILFALNHIPSYKKLTNKELEQLSVGAVDARVLLLD